MHYGNVEHWAFFHTKNSLKLYSHFCVEMLAFFYSKLFRRDSRPSQFNQCIETESRMEEEEEELLCNNVLSQTGLSAVRKLETPDSSTYLVSFSSEGTG